MKDLATSADLQLYETELPWPTAAVRWARVGTGGQLTDAMAELPLA
ncbi:hypothetical protein [Lentzea sp.]|nr:hypothetical protein [Lentzea sp.]HUQ61536.1 hypothetical protein [Lentzea sp.]